VKNNCSGGPANSVCGNFPQTVKVTAGKVALCTFRSPLPEKYSSGQLHRHLHRHLGRPDQLGNRYLQYPAVTNRICSAARPSIDGQQASIEGVVITSHAWSTWLRSSKKRATAFASLSFTITDRHPCGDAAVPVTYRAPVVVSLPAQSPTDVSCSSSSLRYVS
jgi:hypothetical protein